jgi:hypothetical protein
VVNIGRLGLPSDGREQMRELWKAGSSISEVSRTAGSPPRSIFSILLPFSGFYQPPKRRRPGTLSLVEREEISRGLDAGESSRTIGCRLGRSDLVQKLSPVPAPDPPSSQGAEPPRNPERFGPYNR